MKLAVLAGDLSAALDCLGRVIERHNTIPILGAVLIEAVRGKTTVHGTDLDFDLTLTVAATVARRGSVAVQFHAFRALLSALPREEPVTIEAGESCVVTTSGGRYEFPIYPADDFPRFKQAPDPKEPDFRALEFADSGASEFASVIGRALTCVLTEETRYYLNGVCLDFVEDIPLAVATDGHRLMAQKLPIAKPEKAKSVIIPTKGAKLIARFAPCWMNLGENGFAAGGPGWKLGGRLIGGNFPDWRRAVPKPEGEARVTFSVPALVTALWRLAKVQSGERPAIALACDGDRCALHSYSLDITGCEIVEVETENLDGPELCGLNMFHLLALLRTLRGDRVTLRIAGAGAPMLISDGSDTTCVLMPMRVVGDKAVAALGLVHQKAA